MAHRVYLGRLPATVRQRDIERFFEGYGKVHDIVLKNGFGFLEFEDGRDAEEAVNDLNGKSLLGERLILVQHANSSVHRNNNRRPARGDRLLSNLFVIYLSGWGAGGSYGPPTRTEYRVRIENLSSRCNWQDLKEYLNKTGEVCFCDCNNRRMNEGVAEFATLGDMKNVITKLNGKEFFGRTIRIIDDRDGSRSNSRKRSYSKSRSRSPY
ncbi:hypothetical protein HELRODRAFT_62111 [Helobdella robusta]|uniref:RRM domain-containing protein n=1 Tax=Helobdella robusta TaxID=6412 RepID=T1FWW0_HELRO|nr:hypothetical protein HELRODRAFT_62111 [Helobdella robusta]ESO12989.1 hypothetical protein HELRODRAFT_62111 [Helobdella robusta]